MLDKIIVQEYGKNMQVVFKWVKFGKNIDLENQDWLYPLILCLAALYPTCAVILLKSS